jgi:hypothetical protein
VTDISDIRFDQNIDIYKDMSDYTKHLARQLGIKESSIKPVDMDAMDVDPEELEMGTKDETEHTDDPTLAKKIALHHLKKHGDYYSKLKGAGLDEKQPAAIDRIMSPTAIQTPVIGMTVRGSNTGGLPSGADQTGISPKTPTGRLGGYEPIPTAKTNSELVDKTPKNSTIDSSSPIAEEPPVDSGDEHPHQTQNNADEPPQAVTGASEEESELTLKSAMPQGIDVDVSEEQTDECSDCGCGKPHVSHDFKQNEKEELKEQTQKVSTKLLQEVRHNLSEKAASGKMSAKESELFSTITEVLRRRGLGLEQKLFGKKSMLETANVKKLSEGEIPTEELAATWADDKNGEYIQINPDDSVWYVAHGKAMEEIADKGTRDFIKFGLIRGWIKENGVSYNIWRVNDHGNVELYSSNGKALGGLV